MRKIGLHIRISHSLPEAVTHAKELGIPIFQIFLIDQIARKPLSIDAQAQQLFDQIKQDGLTPYVHGSYFMNLAKLSTGARKTLEREIKQAEQLGAPHIVLHPGSATGGLTHAKGLSNLAKLLNELTAQKTAITILLENTAHGGNSIGSDLNDFKKLKVLLNHPDRIAFCIDTAHAHAYGYDLSTQEGREKFIKTLDQTIGIENIALIHLNDSHHEAGSRIDKHAEIGKGTIGSDALRAFVLHPKIATIPLILELPALSKNEELKTMKTVTQWDTKKDLP